MRYLALVLVFAGCTDLFGPDVRFWNMRPLEPVPVPYATWYAEVEACLGTRGDFDEVVWGVADSIVVGGLLKAGATKFPRTIIMGQRFAAKDWAVKHEMSHQITGIGDGLHDARGKVPCQ